MNLHTSRELSISIQRQPPPTSRLTSMAIAWLFNWLISTQHWQLKSRNIMRQKTVIPILSNEIRFPTPPTPLPKSPSQRGRIKLASSPIKFKKLLPCSGKLNSSPKKKKPTTSKTSPIVTNDCSKTTLIPRKTFISPVTSEREFRTLATYLKKLRTYKSMRNSPHSRR